MGGDDAFIRRLDASFLPGFAADRGENNNAGIAIYNPGNEPSFLIPFLYNYVPGHHWKTANQTRAIVDEFCMCRPTAEILDIACTNGVTRR